MTAPGARSINSCAAGSTASPEELLAPLHKTALPCHSVFFAEVVVVESLLLDSSPQAASSKLSSSAANNPATTARFEIPEVLDDVDILLGLLVLVSSVGRRLEGKVDENTLTRSKALACSNRR
ncbi:unannotated protein [freshwater metagenome]|uniref:Unannotated protein n=1 Tax=freshwater metagenome TaxID=449393 RepID=A0A6J6ZX41_9ZZZZ